MTTRRKMGKSRYARPRIVQSWNKPLRAYTSGLATAAWDDGKRGTALVEAVSKIVPRWRAFFDTPPTDGALLMRAHNSRCGPTSKTEAPEVNVHKKDIWPIAKRDYKAGKRTFRPE
ncbi:hypothetical protein [Bradyrhizobium sp. USDA 4529]